MKHTPISRRDFLKNLGIADTLVEALENWEAHYKEKGESV